MVPCLVERRSNHQISLDHQSETKPCKTAFIVSFSFPSTSNHTKIDILRQLRNGDLIDIRTWLRNLVNKPFLQEDIDQELNLISQELPPCRKLKTAGKDVHFVERPWKILEHRHNFPQSSMSNHSCCCISSVWQIGRYWMRAPLHEWNRRLIRKMVEFDISSGPVDEEAP